jgi:hypothetical protein
LLTVAVALAFLVFILPLAANFPLLDPDEGLHASIAQEMVERGDWVVPHFLGKPFLDKPILYFWCQAISLRCFGMNEFAVRLPGLLLGLLGCTTTGIVGYRLFDRTTGLVSCIFYGTMLLPVALAQVAVHDVALVPCVNIAILLFWRADQASSWKSSLGFALAIGAVLGISILAKGLVGVALVGISYGSYLLLARQLTVAACVRGAIAIVVAAAIASIWYLMVEMRESDFLEYYFIDRHVRGFATASQKHGDAPWWLYLPVLIVGGLPWIGYLPVTIKELLLSEKSNTSKEIEPTCLLWCWLLGCTILLSAAQSKLVTYVWPVFPAVAILTSLGWSRLLSGTLSPASKISLRKNFILSSFAGPMVLPIAVVVLQRIYALQFDWPTWTVILLASLGTLAPLWFLFREKWQGVLIASALSTTAQFVAVLFFLVPAVADFHSEKQLAQFFNTSATGSLPCKATALPNKMIFVEERIGSFVFYLTPSLRASLVENQLLEIPRPKIMPKEKISIRPGATVILPQKGFSRAEQYIDLKNLKFEVQGRYFILHGVER